MFRIASVHTGFPMAQRFNDAIRETCGTEISFVNVADDNVLATIREDGKITDDSFQRIRHLVEALYFSHPDLVIGTCSSIGDVIDTLAKDAPVPVLRIDEPMAIKAVATGNNVAVIGTNISTIGPSCDLVKRKGKDAGKDVNTCHAILDQLFPIFDDGKNKEGAVDYAVEEINKAGIYDVIMLAQASLTGFREDIEKKTGVPVLASIPLCAEYVKTTYFS